MIAFKYTKTDGAEFLSHLDLLRHTDRTLRRAGIAVKYSQGFNRHPRIFMGSPLALGVRSVAEYCAVETDFDGDFMAAFNANSPHGVKCTAYRTVENNPNYAASITACRYEAAGNFPLSPSDVLDLKDIIICDRRGRTVDIRPRILSLEKSGTKLAFTLTCGDKNLRPDLFCEWLEQTFGAAVEDILKTESSGGFIF